MEATQSQPRRCPKHWILLVDHVFHANYSPQSPLFDQQSSRACPIDTIFCSAKIDRDNLDKLCVGTELSLGYRIYGQVKSPLNEVVVFNYSSGSRKNNHLFHQGFRSFRKVIFFILSYDHVYCTNFHSLMPYGIPR